MNCGRWFLALLAGVLALACHSTTPARAANPFYCNGYATAAVQAFNAAKTNRCGFGGPRWHANLNGHRTWCLIAPQPLADAETAARNAELRPCQCEFYANQAMVQVATAIWKKCGFHGPRWIENRPAHQNWCMTVPPGNVLFEAQQRQIALASCP